MEPFSKKRVSRGVRNARQILRTHGNQDSSASSSGSFRLRTYNRSGSVATNNFACTNLVQALARRLRHGIAFEGELWAGSALTFTRCFSSRSPACPGVLTSNRPDAVASVETQTPRRT